mgnify:FL=1
MGFFHEKTGEEGQGKKGSRKAKHIWTSLIWILVFNSHRERERHVYADI